MTSYERITTGEFANGCIAYKDADGKVVIYDTGSQFNLNSAEDVRAFIPDGGIDRIRKYSKDEIVLLTKDAISFCSELPDMTGRKFYVLPCKRLPFMVRIGIKTIMPVLKLLLKAKPFRQYSKELLAYRLSLLANRFHLNLHFTPGLLEVLLNSSAEGVNFPIVQMEVNGKRRNMIFDTGASFHFVCDLDKIVDKTGQHCEWLAMEGRWGTLDKYRANIRHSSGLEFNTSSLLSLVGHRIYTLQLALLNCQGVLGIEQMNDYDICINKDESVIFIERQI